MSELCLSIKNKSKITSPKLDEDFPSAIFKICFGSNSTSRECLEFQRLLYVDPLDDSSFIVLINGDMYRYTNLKSISINYLIM